MLDSCALLLWTSTATLGVTTPSREWLVPPGYGLWVPGGIGHAVGNRKTSAFASAFRRATDQTPGTYAHAGTAPPHAPGRQPDSAHPGPAP